MEEKVFCTSCGADLARNMRFCPLCGAPNLARETQTEQNPPAAAETKPAPKKAAGPKRAPKAAPEQPPERPEPKPEPRAEEAHAPQGDAPHPHAPAEDGAPPHTAAPRDPHTPAGAKPPRKKRGLLPWIAAAVLLVLLLASGGYIGKTRSDFQLQLRRMAMERERLEEQLEDYQDELEDVWEDYRWLQGRVEDAYAFLQDQSSRGSENFRADRNFLMLSLSNPTDALTRVPLTTNLEAPFTVDCRIQGNAISGSIAQDPDTGRYALVLSPKRVGVSVVGLYNSRTSETQQLMVAVLP